MGYLAATVRELSRFRGLESLQNVHPLIVHYPIALLTLSPVLYLAAWAMRRDTVAWTALWMLALGTLSAGLAVWTGLRAGSGVMVAESVRQHILVHHKHLMLVVFSLSIILSAWALYARPMPQRGRGLFVVLLLLMTFLIAAGADYGAWMVYGYNAGGALPQPIEFDH